MTNYLRDMQNIRGLINTNGTEHGRKENRCRFMKTPGRLICYFVFITSEKFLIGRNHKGYQVFYLNISSDTWISLKFFLNLLQLLFNDLRSRKIIPFLDNLVSIFIIISPKPLFCMADLQILISYSGKNSHFLPKFLIWYDSFSSFLFIQMKLLWKQYDSSMDFLK